MEGDDDSDDEDEEMEDHVSGGEEEDDGDEVNASITYLCTLAEFLNIGRI